MPEGRGLRNWYKEEAATRSGSGRGSKPTLPLINCGVFCLPLFSFLQQEKRALLRSLASGGSKALKQSGLANSGANGGEGWKSASHKLHLSLGPLVLED